MSEPRETRLKRLHMRSMRRGMKEMDLILSAFCAEHLAQMDDAGLDLYDAMLDENDQELYLWVLGHTQGPSQFSELLKAIGEHAGAR